MSVANPLWGAPRIHGEPLKLGIDIGQATVSEHMDRHRRPPSQNWRTFLENHAKEITSIDFFTVPTATFRVFFVFLILDNRRRRILHFHVTAAPSAAWTGQQMIETFRSPWQNAYVERLIGSTRRECLDHMIIFNERQLLRVLRGYFAYYQGSRTHLGLEKDCPVARRVEPPERGRVCEEPMVGGLHHRYFRQAA